MEFDLVHRAIMEDAVQIANQAVLNDPVLVEYAPKRTNTSTGRFRPENRTPDKRRAYVVAGETFRYDPTRTNRAGLTLSMDEGARTLPPQILNRLHKVAGEAMRLALKRNSQKVGYLVLMDAWNGNNYFDRFADTNEQLRLL